MMTAVRDDVGSVCGLAFGWEYAVCNGLAGQVGRLLQIALLAKIMLSTGQLTIENRQQNRYL